MKHPDVQTVVSDTLARITAAGKPAGILTTDDDMIKSALNAGARFVAVALDIDMLLRTAMSTASKWQAYSR